MKGKRKTDEVFDLVNVNHLNNYLETIMPDLTVKIFRTYRSS